MRQELTRNWTITHCVVMEMSTYLACKSASASATACFGAASLLPNAPEVVGRPVSWNKIKPCKRVRFTPCYRARLSPLFSLHTAVSRNVVGRNVHATILKGNMGYDQYTVRNDWSCRTYFCYFPLVLTNICPWPPVPFFQISLKKSAHKATHNTFRGCCVHFFGQPFSK